MLDWILTHNNPVKFVDPDGMSPRPNRAEVRLALKSPRHMQAALKMKNNAPIALDQARQFARESTGNNRAAMVESLNEGEGKAVRHAFFSAINARDVGVDMARKFGQAHEVIPDNKFETMDLMNNEVGFQIIHDNPDAATNEEIYNLVIESLEAGKLTTSREGANPDAAKAGEYYD